LHQIAATNMTQARSEERDKSPVYFRPNISYYTR
jgi:hypothetical protein